MQANLPTRIVYSLALLSFLLSALAGSSGWISLMLGGGLVSGLGSTVFGIVAGLVAFRAYQVLRYPRALEARAPNALGKLLRIVGWIGMFVGVAMGVGLFLVKPITLLLFKSAGDAGIGYLVVGLALIAFSNLGWLGCVLFEVSRVCGQAPAKASEPWSRRKQDFVVLGVLVAAAVFAPYLIRGAVGEPCGDGNLAACVSTTQGEVRRIIVRPAGEPVMLDSNLEEIEMRGTVPRKWSLVESPANSLDATGHPVTTTRGAPVRVRVWAKSEDPAVVLEVAFFEGTEETARFTTRYSQGAKLEETRSRGLRLVVDLPANAESGLRSLSRDATGKGVTFDHLFILFRSGIGSESEAKEWTKRVERTAVLVSTDTSPSALPADAQKDPACVGKVETSNAKERAFQGNLGMMMKAVTFKQSSEPGPHALMGIVDRLICREGEFWILSYWDRRPNVRVRRYDVNGTLTRFVDTAVPPRKRGELDYDLIDSQSLREQDGRIRFERVVVQSSEKGREVKKREVFELVP